MKLVLLFLVYIACGLADLTCSVETLVSHHPQLHVAVSKVTAKAFIDCKLVGEKSISAAGNITTDGLEVLGRMVRSRGSRDNSAPVSSHKPMSDGAMGIP